MLGGIIGAASAGMGIAGQVGSALMAKRSTEKAMRFGEAQRRNQHQVEVADLRAAGLNPILSAHKGAGTTGGHTYNPKIDMAQLALTAAQARKTWLEGDILKPQATIKSKAGDLLETVVGSSTAKALEKSVGQVSKQPLFGAMKPLSKLPVIRATPADKPKFNWQK